MAAFRQNAADLDLDESSQLMLEAERRESLLRRWATIYCVACMTLRSEENTNERKKAQFSVRERGEKPNVSFLYSTAFSYTERADACRGRKKVLSRGEEI